MSELGSWGNWPRAARQEARTIPSRTASLPRLPPGTTLLPRGLGRSYGDSCLNDGGVLLETRRLDHFIDFDDTTGILRCEAGVTLAEILATLMPRGWFLPVSPGTQHVTVAGALANDVHGKNHHRAGTFGRHVTRFELLRSDGRRRECSPEQEPELYRATIGGLGLTGLVTWVELRMKPVPGELIDCESIRFGSLDEFFALAAESDRDFEYTAAWADGLGPARGRGIFLRGNHSEGNERRPPPRSDGPLVSIPGYAPELLLNDWAVRAFNTVYFHRQRQRVVRGDRHYRAFFYPLDVVGHWNRLYGRRGFMQYQCVVPPEASRAAAREIFDTCARRGEGSYLVVLKVLGDLPSPGVLSFPRPGVTLCLDFPHRGRSTLELLEDFDRIVLHHGGRVYPAKDARMSAASFQRFFPDWRELGRWVDPLFSSSFWRRVTAGADGRG